MLPHGSAGVEVGAGVAGRVGRAPDYRALTRESEEIENPTVWPTRPQATTTTARPHSTTTKFRATCQPRSNRETDERSERLAWTARLHSLGSESAVHAACRCAPARSRGTPQRSCRPPAARNPEPHCLRICARMAHAPIPVICACGKQGDPRALGVRSQRSCCALAVPASCTRCPDSMSHPAARMCAQSACAQSPPGHAGARR